MIIGGKTLPGSAPVRDLRTAGLLSWQSLGASSSASEETAASLPLPALSGQHDVAGTRIAVGRVQMLGPFRVESPEGHDCTPHSRKTRALVAMLVLSPHGTRSRAWLRDKLWSDRGENQASGSLRQALSELRRAFAVLPSDVLSADASTVSLDLNRLDIDIHDVQQDSPRLGPVAGTPLQLLEGLDVRDPEFEEWLRAERAFWMERLAAGGGGQRPRDEASPSPATARPSLRPIGAALSPRRAIGLLPGICLGCDETATLLPDMLIEAIVRSATELLPLDIYDYRTTNGAHGTGVGPEFLLRVQLRRVGRRSDLSILLYRTASQELVWSHVRELMPSEDGLPDGEAQSSFIAEVVDRLAAHLVISPALADSPVIYPAAYEALNLIFRVEEGALARAETLLHYGRAENEGLAAAMLSYVSTFRLGEHIGEWGDLQRAATMANASQALTVQPFNSVALACLGHVYAYVMRDFEMAGELHGQALRLNPNQAFVWDHYALHNIYVGRYQAAFDAAREAVRLGSFSPLRYSYETTMCMAATMIGDYATAMRYGNRALSRQPRFLAAMRYLLACYGHAGQMEAASALLARLDMIDPDFCMESVRQNGMALADHDGQRRLLAGFAMAGLKAS
jgi:hypothetical protein